MNSVVRETTKATRSKANGVEPPVVLHAVDLHKSFGGQKVLNGSSLELRRGNVALLRGDNGSGKTTLLNILTGNLAPDAGSIHLQTDGFEEHFRFPKRWWQTLNPFDHFTPERVARENVGRSWQDIRLFETQDLCSNIAVAAPKQVGENPIWALFWRPKVYRDEQVNLASARRRLADLGLEGRERSSADRVSLGQAKRVAIARAVQAGAKILFLDEPLSGLDADGVNEVLELLDSLGKEQGITLVIVEHIFHIHRLLNRVDTIWTLDQGRITVQTPSEVREELKDVANDGLTEWMTNSGKTNVQCIDEELGNGAVFSVIAPLGRQRREAILEIEGLVVKRGNRVVVGEPVDGDRAGLNFSIREGEIAILRAPNGWGKTTLLEAIAGIVPVASGEIRFRGKLIQELPPWERFRLGISLLQSRSHTFASLTVKETLQLAEVSEISMRLHSLSGRRTADLSGGEKQLLALSIAFGANKPQLTLLDEPFAMLDHSAIQEVVKTAMAESGTTKLICVPNLLERR